jgi:hypothetical protein
MLCGHEKKFIYLKTRKTAGTSVEIFFERFCMPSRQFHESRTTKQIISETGIVGARGTLLIKPDFYNHMPASEVRTKLGREIFDSYYKFCVTRNPFDKIVSHFWWDSRKVPDFSNDPFSKIRHRFAEYVSQGFGGFNDHFIFMVDGYPVIDEFIRYEYLSSDIEQVCRALDIDISVELGSYRTEFRKRPEHFSEYYDSATKEFVEREFTWEMDRFNYTLSG